MDRKLVKLTEDLADYTLYLNFGETPAFLMRSCVEITKGAPEVYLNVLTRKAGDAVEKRGICTLDHGRVNDFIQGEDGLREILIWKKILCCYGFVEYTDYLGTKFMGPIYEYDPKEIACGLD